jgi:hypothetical protein
MKRNFDKFYEEKHVVLEKGDIVTIRDLDKKKKSYLISKSGISGIIAKNKEGNDYPFNCLAEVPKRYIKIIKRSVK